MNDWISLDENLHKNSMIKNFSYANEFQKNITQSTENAHSFFSPTKSMAKLNGMKRLQYI